MAYTGSKTHMVEHRRSMIEGVVVDQTKITFCTVVYRKQSIRV